MDKFDVVAAIIIKDDKYFIAQRNRNKHMGLSWEFPGGKVEKGETFDIALKRYSKSSISFYRSLRRLNPSPFLFHFNFKDFFVRVDILEKLFISILDKTKNRKFTITSDMMNLLGCSKENFYKLMTYMNYIKILLIVMLFYQVLFFLKKKQIYLLKIIILKYP